MKKLLIIITFSVLLFGYGRATMADHVLHQYLQHSMSEPARVAVSENPIYSKECGSCHLAYPAALLPARSWDKLMSHLGEHFGDNAELAQETQADISAYLIAHAAEYSEQPYAAKWLRSIPMDAVPLRITEIPAFKKVHRMMPRMLVKMGKVKSLSLCNNCHDDATTGQFETDKVRVPLMCSQNKK